MPELSRKLLARRGGAVSLEYASAAAVLGLAVVVAATTIGNLVTTSFNRAAGLF